MLIAVAAVLSTLHLEGDVTADGTDYAEVTFVVPAGTVEMQIAHDDHSTFSILDFGVWSPSAAPGGDFRGWGGGLTDDIIIGEAQSSRGYLPGPVTAGTWTLVIGKAKLDAGNTHYTADVTFRDAATIPVEPQADFTPVVMATERRYYKGDFHVHSRESGDASATLQQDADLGHANGLDFANFSDHNTVSQHALIAATQATWPLLALRGSEITTYSGHANAVGNVAYVDHRLGLRGRTVADIVADVTAQDAILIVNHPATDLGDNCIGCAWKHEDDAPWDGISGIEVLTGGWDVSVEAFTPTVLQLWDRLETAGHRLAAIGGSDDHSAGLNEGSTGAPVGEPCTNVLADELSEAGIIAGVKAHHTLVQLRGCADVMVEATMLDKAGHPADVGDDVDGIDEVALTVHVTHGDGDFAQVWRDGELMQQQAIAGADDTWVYREEPGAADHRYRVEMIDSGSTRILITSHFYVHGIAHSGCDAGGGSAGGLVALGLLALVRRERASRATRRRG